MCTQIPSGMELSKFDFSEISDFAVQLRYDVDFWPEKKLHSGLKFSGKVMPIVKILFILFIKYARHIYPVQIIRSNIPPHHMEISYPPEKVGFSMV